MQQLQQTRVDPWVGKVPGGGHSNPLPCPCLENPMDRGAWQATRKWSQRWTRLKQLSTARQGCILPTCLLNSHAEYIMQNAGLDEPQAGIKIAGRNITNLRYADDTTLTAQSEEN